jgi:hypothetical protein
MFMAATRSAFALPSLSGTDRLDIPVTFGALSLSYTVIRDADDQQQWYYVPDQPRFEEQHYNGTTAPQFSLVRYQVPDSQDPSKFTDHGLLQFAVTLAAPATALTQMTSYLTTHGHSNATLSALPIDSAEATLYTPSGDLIVSRAAGEGIAPVFASQAVVFSLPLTDIGAAVYDAIINGTSGIPVAVTFSFQGETPPGGFVITVHQRQLYHHYSHDTQFAARASYYGLFGASVNVHSQSFYDDLTNNNDITVSVEQGSSDNAAEIDKYLEPVLNYVNSNLLQGFPAPTKITPAQASSPDASGFFGGVGLGVATKTVDENTLNDFTYRYSTRHVQVKKTIAAALLGLHAYPEAVRKQLVTVVDASQPTSAIFSPPLIGDEGSFIRGITATVQLFDNGTFAQQQIFRWAPNTGWTDIHGAKRSSMGFGLLKAATTYSQTDRENTYFNVATLVKTAGVGPSVQFDVKRMPAFLGEAALGYVTDALDVVEVTSNGLSWYPQGQLDTITVVLTNTDGSQVMRILQPVTTGNTQVAPSPLDFLVRRPQQGGSSPQLVVTFNLHDGSDVRYACSGDIYTNHLLAVALRDASLHKTNCAP